MEIAFCEDCDNMLYLYTDEEKRLHNACKACGKISEVNQETRCIYNNSQLQVDKSEIINTNKYITHDITLPVIQGNKNIKCMNSECDAEESKITYIKYDSEEMKYIYICNHCGYKWKNNL